MSAGTSDARLGGRNDGEEASPRDPLRRRALETPSRPALEGRERRWSFEALDRDVDRACAGLRALGVGRGERVALLLRTTPEAVIALQAIARCGAVAAPLSFRLTAGEVAEALKAVDPVLLLLVSGTARSSARAAAEETGSRLGTVKALLEGREEGGDILPADGPQASGRPVARWPDPEEPRAILWTSGTSGSPRGVVLSEGNLAASARASRKRLGLSPRDRWVATLSVAHIGGLALVDRAVRIGATLLAEGGFDVDRLVGLLRRGRVSHASLVPVMLRRLLDRWGGAPAPDGLGLFLLGGDRTPESLLERALAAGWPVALTYGMTEASSQVATALPERVRRKPGTVGRPLPGAEVRIAEGGEIRVRGPTLARGYLGGRSLDLDEEGWLRTGDRGRLDEEGDLWVTGRLSERIVSGGVTVEPDEVAEALHSLSEIEDAAVVGLPDPEWGERVAAAVVAAPGTRPERGGRDGRPPAWLERRLNERLSGPKRPRVVGFVDRLPRTRTGKVDRAAVRRFLDGLAGG